MAVSSRRTRRTGNAFQDGAQLLQADPTFNALEMDTSTPERMAQNSLAGGSAADWVNGPLYQTGASGGGTQYNTFDAQNQAAMIQLMKDELEKVKIPQVEQQRIMAEFQRDMARRQFNEIDLPRWLQEKGLNEAAANLRERQFKEGVRQFDQTSTGYTGSGQNVGGIYDRLVEQQTRQGSRLTPEQRALAAKTMGFSDSQAQAYQQFVDQYLNTYGRGPDREETAQFLGSIGVGGGFDAQSFHNRIIQLGMQKGGGDYKRLNRSEWVEAAKGLGISEADAAKMGNWVYNYVQNSPTGNGPTPEMLANYARNEHVGEQKTLGREDAEHRWNQARADMTGYDYSTPTGFDAGEFYDKVISTASKDAQGNPVPYQQLSKQQWVDLALGSGLDQHGAEMMADWAYNTASRSRNGQGPTKEEIANFVAKNQLDRNETLDRSIARWTDERGRYANETQRMGTLGNLSMDYAKTLADLKANPRDWLKGAFFEDEAPDMTKLLDTVPDFRKVLNRPGEYDEGVGYTPPGEAPPPPPEPAPGNPRFAGPTGTPPPPQTGPVAPPNKPNQPVSTVDPNGLHDFIVGRQTKNGQYQRATPQEWVQGAVAYGLQPEEAAHLYMLVDQFAQHGRGPNPQELSNLLQTVRDYRTEGLPFPQEAGAFMPGNAALLSATGERSVKAATAEMGRNVSNQQFGGAASPAGAGMRQPMPDLGGLHDFIVGKQTTNGQYQRATPEQWQQHAQAYGLNPEQAQALYGKVQGFLQQNGRGPNPQELAALGRELGGPLQVANGGGFTMPGQVASNSGGGLQSQVDQKAWVEAARGQFGGMVGQSFQPGQAKGADLPMQMEDVQYRDVQQNMQQSGQNPQQYAQRQYEGQQGGLTAHLAQPIQNLGGPYQLAQQAQAKRVQQMQQAQQAKPDPQRLNAYQQAWRYASSPIYAGMVGQAQTPAWGKPQNQGPVNVNQSGLIQGNKELPGIAAAHRLNVRNYLNSDKSQQEMYQGLVSAHGKDPQDYLQKAQAARPTGGGVRPVTGFRSR